jgi:dTDP-4-amino-4,6-dideoxygalactose transaminase
VIQALLAAGSCPVFADIDPATGNIDVASLSHTVEGKARAILTTNLYGNPDSVLELKHIADANGLLLIEDCAHVLHTTLDRRTVGSVGDVSVFSFKKHFDEPGGVITLKSGDAARLVGARVATETCPPAPSEERLRYLQFLVARCTSSSVAAHLSRVYTGPLRGRAARNGARSNDVVTSAPPTRPPWLPLPATAALLRVAASLSRWEALVSDRNAAARQLIASCPLELKKSRHTQEVCYLAVPFFSSRRDAIVAAMKERGIPTYFLYSPPMNEVFIGLASVCRLDTDRISHWSRNILPVGLRFCREYLEAIQSLS